MVVFVKGIRKVIFAGLYWFGIQLLARVINRRHNKVPILMYHSVSNQVAGSKLKSCLDLAGMVISEETFESNIKYLSSHYNVICLEEYVGKIVNNECVKPDSVVITFDDCFIDNFIVAYPILKKYGVHATFFPIGNSFRDKGEIWLHYIYHLLDSNNSHKIFVEIDGDIIVDSGMGTEREKLAVIKQLRSFLEKSDEWHKVQLVEKLEKSLSNTIPSYKKNYMTKNEINILSMNGFSFGGHTMSHRKMSTLSFEEKRDDIINTKFLLKEISPSSFMSFAYPHGQKQDFDHEDKQLLADNGFVCALTTIEGLNCSNADLFELKRIEVGEFSHYEFVLHITGVFGAAKAYAKKVLKK